MVAVGVLLPTREAVIRGSTEARPLIEFAHAVEDRGFDSVWAGDSLTARPRLEPITLLSAVASACTDVTIGTAALTATIRHPLLAAHGIATLDQVAEGRLILGLGTGFPYPETEAEFAAAGAPFGQRLGRLAETVKLWRVLWDPDLVRSQPLRFSGRYWEFDGIERVPPPYRAGGPPLWFAGAGETGLRLAGKLFDGWLPYTPDPDAYATARDAIDRAAADANRGPGSVTAALYVTINLQSDASTARSELENYAFSYYGFPLEIMEQLQAFYAGDATGCIEWLQAFVRAGAVHIILRMGSLADAATQLERAAAEVLGPLKQSS